MDIKTARLDSKLYFDLYEMGGDKLIAVYSILKTSRNAEVKYYAYKSKNNKFVGGFNLLRAKTNLTLHTIKKYVPMLIDMGLCFIDKNGDFVLLGNKKVNELYKSKKLVPILIGKNITQTVLFSLAVRAFSSERKQKIQIKRKLTRNEVINQGKYPKNLEEFNKSKRLLKKYGIVKVTEKTVLSSTGFGILKHSKENFIKDVKSSGSYWRNKLKTAEIISTKREFTKIKKMSYSEYTVFKKYTDSKNSFIYKNGYLVEETASSFTTNSVFSTTPISIKKETVSIPTTPPCITTKSNEEVYKRKQYLQFDMIDFWINGDGR